jgi:hypothetical protein
MTQTRSVIVSLNVAQVRLHGWPRCIVGGGTMYLSIPGFVLLNLTIVVALLHGVLAPLFGVPRARWADHVFLDRGRITQLFWLDRLNCQFCAYANGLCTLLNTQLDDLAAVGRRAGAVQWAVAGVAAVVTAPLWVLFDLYTIRFLYDGIISRCLRMHRFSRADGNAVMEAGGYGASLPPLARWVLRAWKNSALALESLLEQIESAWCPLRHFETREGIVFPRHHKRFFGASTIEELREARRYLHANAGTVSERGLAVPLR